MRFILGDIGIRLDHRGQELHALTVFVVKFTGFESDIFRSEGYLREWAVHLVQKEPWVRQLAHHLAHFPCEKILLVLGHKRIERLLSDFLRREVGRSLL